MTDISQHQDTVSPDPEKPVRSFKKVGKDVTKSFITKLSQIARQKVRTRNRKGRKRSGKKHHGGRGNRQDKKKRSRDKKKERRKKNKKTKSKTSTTKQPTTPENVPPQETETPQESLSDVETPKEILADEDYDSNVEKKQENKKTEFGPVHEDLSTWSSYVQSASGKDWKRIRSNVDVCFSLLFNAKNKSSERDFSHSKSFEKY